MGKALHAIALQGMERSFLICRSFQRVQNSWEWVSAGAVAPWAFCILWSTMEPDGIALSGEKMGEI